MGMYTEFVLGVDLCSDLPETVVEALRFMCTGELEPAVLPEHKVFTLPRWTMIGRGGSASFRGGSSSRISRNWKDEWYLSIRCNLKNYDDEIETFLDFLEPYLRPCGSKFVGTVMYEEWTVPKLIYQLGKEFELFHYDADRILERVYG